MNTENKSVVAKFAPEETGECRGMAMMICPVCDNRILETDLERYYEQNSQNKVELCSSCREEFESDNDLLIDSDTLNCDVYGKLWEFSLAAVARFVESHQGLNEITAPLVAAALGGDAQQIGGEKWVIVKRTSDGRVLMLSPKVINEYANEKAFIEDCPTIRLVMS